MSFVPDGKFAWNPAQGPVGIILLNSDDSDIAKIDNDNDNAGDTVGRLQAVSDNSADTFTFSIVKDLDQKFYVDGSLLKAASDFNYNQAVSHNVTIRATDQSSNFLDREFVLMVDAEVEGPEYDNVDVLFVDMVGEGALEELAVAVNHIAALQPTLFTGVVNGMIDVTQVHELTLGSIAGKGELQELTAEQLAASFFGTGTLATMTMQQNHAVQLLPVRSKSSLGAMPVNDIIFQSITGKGWLHYMQVTYVPKEIQIHMAALGSTQEYIGLLTIQQQHIVVPSDLTGEGVLAAMTAEEE